MTTIIVPTDFSQESMTGLNLAALFADKMNASIEMVHVITEANDASPEVLENERLLAKQNFEKILQDFKSGDQNPIALSYVIKEGNVQQEVSAHISSYEDVLTVLSTHGTSGFKELLIGGNAYKIMSASRHPVVTIRGSKIPETISKIVMPINITFETREKVPFTSSLAKLFNAEIHVVTVRSTNARSIEKKLLQYSDQVCHYVSNLDIPFKLEHLHGSNHTDITRDYATSINADLISIMEEQEKSISNLFQGSYTHQMINSASIPVLVFPNYPVEIPTEDLRTQGIYYE